MIKTWDADRVIAECHQMYIGANDPYVTGWNNWPCKQDLLRVKLAVDDMLEDCPTFSGEDEWLEQQSKEKTWKILKKE